MSALQAARVHNDEYQRRVNTDAWHGDMKERFLVEDRAYKQAMMQAAIAQGEQLAFIAMQLGNIHMTLITPNNVGEPVTVADILKTIAATQSSIAHSLERVAESLERALPIAGNTNVSLERIAEALIVPPLESRDDNRYT